MRNAHAALHLAVLALVAGAVVATGPVGATGTGDAAATTPAVTDDTTTGDDLSVTIETPRTVVTNASLNYSVDVTGATGNVTATWSFAGETEKTGRTVTHAFAEPGNATIEVTVTDESGATVSESKQVEVVEFGDEDDDPNRARNVATFGLWVGMFLVITFAFILVLLPKGMEVITDALSR